MPEPFNGWPVEAFDLLLRFDGVPALSTLEPYRAERERLVRDPMIALCAEVADGYTGEGHVWTIHRHHESWQRQIAVFQIAPHVVFWLELNLSGLSVEGAWWKADTTEVERYRAAVAADTGAELAHITACLQQNGYEIQGEKLKRVPRAYPPDHPRANLLRYRRLFAQRDFGAPDWLHTPRAVDHVRATFDDLHPLTSWLATYCCPLCPP
ncbi:DUF2461 family protein [Actinopolymorpha alba]|uniref:DUF2461 family protein n=1 Tax=Actinopolymorpha alba TaxID=533267 RepID=UPI00037DF7FA|nr:DUF2461 family protein [Actinopolymorpha alba]